MGKVVRSRVYGRSVYLLTVDECLSVCKHGFVGMYVRPSCKDSMESCLWKRFVLSISRGSSQIEFQHRSPTCLTLDVCWWPLSWSQEIPDILHQT